MLKITKRRKWLPVLVAGGCLGMAAFIWNGQQRHSGSQIFVLQKNMGFNQSLRTFWLNNNDLLIIHDAGYVDTSEPLSTKSVEIRHLDTSQSEAVTRFPADIENTTYLYAWVQLTPDRHAMRIWTQNKFTYVPLSGEKQGFTKDLSEDSKTTDTFIKAVDLCPNLDDHAGHNAPSDGRQSTVALYPNNTDHWIGCGGIGMARSEISYSVGSDTGAVSQDHTFHVPGKDITPNTISKCLGLTHDGDILFYFGPDIGNKAPIPSELLEYKIGLPYPVHTYPVTLPIPSSSYMKNLASGMLPSMLPGSQLPALSPDSQRIAWLIPPSDKSSNSKLTAFLRRHHILPPLPDQALWVSNHFGSNMKLVTTLRTENGFVTSLDWTPDGRFITYQQVSVVGSKPMNCTTTLCKVPVPR